RESEAAGIGYYLRKKLVGIEKRNLHGWVGCPQRRQITLQGRVERIDQRRDRASQCGPIKRRGAAQRWHVHDKQMLGAACNQRRDLVLQRDLRNGRIGLAINEVVGTALNGKKLIARRLAGGQVLSDLQRDRRNDAPIHVGTAEGKIGGVGSTHQAGR